MTRPLVTITRMRRKRPKPEKGHALIQTIALFVEALEGRSPEERLLFWQQLKKREPKYSAELSENKA